MIWNWLRKKKKSNTPEANETDKWEQHSNNLEGDNEEQTRSMKHNKGKNNEQKDSSQDKQQSAKQEDSSQDKQRSAKQEDSSQDKQ
ncbi:spore germination protein GerIA, partial [Bacillus cereus]